MHQKYPTRETGNPKVAKLPEELAEQTVDRILIKPAPAISPLSEWAALFAAADVSPEPELNDWEITLQDGLEDE